MRKTGKTALVIGASGLIGTELVKVLTEQNTYKKIHLLVRSPLNINSPICEQHIVDFDQLDQYAALFKVSDVFCSLGTTIKKAKTKEAFRKVDYEYPVQAAKIAVKAGAEKFLIVTAMGANQKSMFFYNQVKGNVEETLKKLSIPSLHIFRPSLLLGERKEFRFGERIAAKASGVFNTLLIGSFSKYKAIEASKVARVMVITSQKTLSGTNIYESHQIEKISQKK